MQNSLLIFLGCGIGGVLRYGVSNLTHLFLGRGFPYGTLVVNVTGSFLIGLLAIIISDRFSVLGSQLRALLIIGLLGGYTTFSSFSFETLSLFELGKWLAAFCNILLSVILCLSGTWLGVSLARHL